MVTEVCYELDVVLFRDAHQESVNARSRHNEKFVLETVCDVVDFGAFHLWAFD